MKYPAPPPFNPVDGPECTLMRAEARAKGLPVYLTEDRSASSSLSRCTAGSSSLSTGSNGNLRARKARRPDTASEERIEPPKTILTTNLGLTSYASNIAVHKTRLVPSTDQKNIDENSIEYNAFDRLPGEARFRR